MAEGSCVLRAEPRQRDSQLSSQRLNEPAAQPAARRAFRDGGAGLSARAPAAPAPGERPALRGPAAAGLRSAAPLPLLPISRDARLCLADSSGFFFHLFILTSDRFRVTGRRFHLPPVLREAETARVSTMVADRNTQTFSVDFLVAGLLAAVKVADRRVIGLEPDCLVHSP